MKKIDAYIIGKFFMTFGLSILLIMCIVIVFDFSENVDDFIEKKAPFNAIAMDFYGNLIPFYINVFSPLFVFISVIFFTSRMASRSEIVAILTSGVSFNRLLAPFLFCACAITGLSLYINHWVLPKANKARLDFEEVYIRSPYHLDDRNIHRQVGQDTYIYFNNYNVDRKTGYQFSMEKIKGGNRYYYLRSDQIRWDTVKKKWTVENYFTRNVSGMNETIKKGLRFDTTYEFTPADFGTRPNRIETMNTRDLQKYINEQRMKGTARIEFSEVEKYQRTATPFASIILTLIGVALASRKVRGGTGLHIGLGLGLSFTYILFMQVFKTTATNGGFSPLIAVWLPNIIFLLVALFLLRSVPK